MSFTTIQLRRGTAAGAASDDPTLAAGEVGVEIDTGKFKIGDGSTAWNSLSYATDLSQLPASVQNATSRVFDVATYGAVADGVTDDSAAINSAVTAASDVGGGIVLLQAGSYALKANPITPASGVSIQGAGAGKTVLLPAGSICGIQWLAGSTASPITDCTFRGFKIDGSNQNDGGAYSAAIKGIYMQYLKRCVFRDLHISNCIATGLGVDFLVDCYGENVIAENNGRGNNGSQPGGAGIGIGTGRYATENQTWVGCVTRSNGTFGIFFETQDGGGQLPTGIKLIGHESERNISHGIADAGCTGMQVIGGYSYENGGAGFAACATPLPNSEAGRAGVVTGLISDSNTLHGVFYDASVRVTSQSRYVFRGCRLVNNTLNGAAIQAGSSIALENMAIIDCEIHDNKLSGICLTSTGAVISNLVINDNRVFSNGRNTSGTNRNGVHIAANLSDAHIDGNQVNDPQADPTQLFGIVQASGSITGGTINGNDLRHNGSGSFYKAGTISVSTSVRNNLGYNPVGALVPCTPFSVPASGTAWTNGTGVDGTAYVISTGTVSGVSVNGVAVSGTLSAGGSYRVPFGGTLTLTYTAAPTLVFVGD